MSSTLPPVARVIRFVDCINRRDLDALVDCMAEQHVSKVLDEPPVEGREANRRAWREYMTSFPRYAILPKELAVQGSHVAVLGSTIGSHLALPDEGATELGVVWTATVENGLLTSWEMLEDSPEARDRLGLQRGASLEAREPEPLAVGHAQGSLRYLLGGRVLSGGDIVELCCSGGWLTGRFEWDGNIDTLPLFFFSIELGAGKVVQHSLAIPKAALLRRLR